MDDRNKYVHLIVGVMNKNKNFNKQKIKLYEVVLYQFFINVMLLI